MNRPLSTMLQNPSASVKGRAARWPFILASFLIIFDVVLSGSFLLSVLTIPIWLLVTVTKAVIQRPGWWPSLKRVAMPLIVGGIVVGNARLQNNIAQGRAETIVDACKRFQKDHGSYPRKLEELAPEYLHSVPRAKYCVSLGEFIYFGDHANSKPILMWVKTPPFGRQCYTFETGQFSYMD